MKKIIVVGGGFTGLVTAYYLGRAGFRVELHEANDRLGGLISTEKTPNGLAESAANGLMLTEDVQNLFSDLGLEYLPMRRKFKRKRFIFRNGLRRWPLGFLETLGFLVKGPFKMIFCKKALTPHVRESIWQWGCRCIGEAATRYFLVPALQGIYAGDARRLSAELIFGPMINAKKNGRKYRGTVAPREGMGQLITALQQALSRQGAEIFLNSRYNLSNANIPHVICTSAHQASQLIADFSKETSQLLQKIETLPVLSVTVFYKVAHKQVRGFGCLFAEDQNFKALGVLSNSYIFENRGGYSETWIFGGVRSAEMLRTSDAEIIATVQQERHQMLGESGEIIDSRIHRWPEALPHYTLALKEILDQLKPPKNIYLQGNYRGGIGLSKILSRTHELVAQITRDQT